jgi:hypothetical protein
MRALSAVLFFALCVPMVHTTPVSRAQDRKARTLEDDLKALHGGVWWMRGRGFGIAFNVDSSEQRVGFLIGRPGDFTPGSGTTFELKEEGKKRYILFGEALLTTGPKAFLGRKVEYKFVGKLLLLVITEGRLKGEHKLDKKKAGAKK